MPRITWSRSRHPSGGLGANSGARATLAAFVQIRGLERQAKGKPRDGSAPTCVGSLVDERLLRDYLRPLCEAFPSLAGEGGSTLGIFGAPVQRAAGQVLCMRPAAQHAQRIAEEDAVELVVLLLLFVTVLARGFLAPQHASARARHSCDRKVPE